MKPSIQQFINASKSFWSNVIPKTQSECWNWNGFKNEDGYGHIGVIGYNIRTHRLSWMIHFGPIPNGVCVCHRCDNPACVNPSHLFLGTVQDNVTDRHLKGRSRGGSQPGESHNMAKLKDDDVRQIFNEARSRSSTQREIAKKYGVTQSAISNILTGKLWRHLNLHGR